MKDCPECGAVWTLEEIEDQYCGGCGWPNHDHRDENDFQCCADCDLPDACEDFGCAIKNGVIKKPFDY